MPPSLGTDPKKIRRRPFTTIGKRFLKRELFFFYPNSIDLLSTLILDKHMTSTPERDVPTIQPPAEKEVEEEEEDDYLTMTFADHDQHSAGKKQTPTELQRRRRERAETAGRPRSKAELARLEEQRRNVGLSSSLMGVDASVPGNQSKGLQMMAKLGFTPGSRLGKIGSEHGLQEPVGMEMKTDRSGVGMDSEKKRKVREEVARVAGEEKRRKVEEAEFRDRVGREGEERRLDGLLAAAKKVAEGLDDDEKNRGDDTRSSSNNHPTRKSINVFWRSLARDRALHDRDRRLRHNTLIRSDSDSDHPESYEVSDDESDAELDAFESRPTRDKLQDLLTYLRRRWHYCFWCKARYPDEAMQGCPGETEEDHD